MLGTFPKAISQVATSQGYFPKWQLPKCAISQAATSQVCPSRSARHLVCSSHSARPLAKRSLRVVAWEISYLGNYNLGYFQFGNHPWENAFEKIPSTHVFVVIIQIDNLL